MTAGHRQCKKKRKATIRAPRRESTEKNECGGGGHDWFSRVGGKLFKSKRKRGRARGNSFWKKRLL